VPAREGLPHVVPFAVVLPFVLSPRRSASSLTRATRSRVRDKGRRYGALLSASAGIDDERRSLAS